MTDSVIGLDASDETKKIVINKTDRFEQLYIIGKTRQGKSTLIENLVLEDIKNDLGVCVVDPHAGLIDNIISRMAFQVESLKDPKLEDKDRKRYEHIKKRLESDVIYIDLIDEKYVAPFNLFHCENTTNDIEVENIVSAFLHILDTSFDITQKTPMMNQYFRHIAMLLVYNQNRTVLDVRRLLADDAFLKELVKNIPDFYEREFWETFYMPYSKGRRRMEDMSMTTNKLEELISPVMRPWFGDTKKPLRFRELMDQRKIVLLKLNPQWETINKIVGNIVIAQLLDAAYSRRNMSQGKRKQMNVYVDEYQKFASEDFAKLFSEAAKYGLSMTISQQVLEQVEPAIKAVCKQAGNFVVFNVSADNGKELASVFDCSPQPGIPRYEPLKTPVMEPIQYMITKGVHPQDTTQQFIKQYGKFLVDKVKEEEDIERDSRRQWQKYSQDLDIQSQRDEFNSSLSPHSRISYSVGFVAAPSIVVSYDWYTLLKSLNDLFYQAMMFGKSGRNPDTMSISSVFIDAFIRAMNLDGKRYLDLKDNYEIYVRSVAIQIVDLDERYKQLRQQLADFQDMQQKEQEEQQQAKLLLHRLKESAVEQEKKQNDANVKYLLRESVDFLSKEVAIVELNGRYYIAYIYRFSNAHNASYTIFISSKISWLQYTSKYGFAGAPVEPKRLSANCTSLRAAINYYCYILDGRWVLLKNVIDSIDSWQKKKEVVLINESIFCDVPSWIMPSVRSGLIPAWGYLNNTSLYEKSPSASCVKEYTLTLNVWTLKLDIMLKKGLIDRLFAWKMKQDGGGQLQSRWENTWTHGIHDILSYDNFREEIRIRSKQKSIEIYNPASRGLDDYVKKLHYKVTEESLKHNTTKEIEKIEKNIEEIERKNEIAIYIEKIKNIEKEQNIIAQLLSEKDIYNSCFSDLEQQIRMIMRELAMSPVQADSGLMQEIPTEILTPEVEARIANQLKQLDKYTARIRISSGEYTITTIKPEGFVSENKLKKYIAEIQERNRKAGYLRLREEVKEEIRKRYEPVSPPTPQVGTINPPSLQKQQKVATQVAAQAVPIPRTRAIAPPVGKQCPDPKCGVQNSPTANFCQGCGKELPKSL